MHEMCVARSKMARTCIHLWQLLFIICFIQVTYSFNLDTGLPIIKTFPVKESYFGFSVAQHQRTLPDNSIENLIIVGAPKYNTSQVNVVQAGGIFSCPVSTFSDDCTQIDIDPEGDESGEEKSDQWLGVTVKSQGIDGKVLACAHRYKQVGPDYRYGNGKCFQMDENYELDTVLTNGGIWRVCEGRTQTNEYYGYCAAGADAAFTKDDSDIIIGTPGSYDWRGIIFTTDLTGDLRADPTLYKSPSSKEGSGVLKHSYLGFSIDSGIINGNDEWIAAGAPRHNASGAVVIFAKDKGNGELVQQQTIYSAQLTSSFGYDIVVVDLNSDGYDDLVVGAPLYYNKEEKIGGGIFVYMNDGKGKLIEENAPFIPGPLDSMFGMSLTSLEDLDVDGYNDIAVGAPYENDGEGAVYIFNGGHDGLRQQHSQKIIASDLNTSDMFKTLGYSLDGGLDLDENGYPDLVIGAYESAKVLLLRTKPVLTIVSSMAAVPSMLDIENKNCTYKGKGYVCFDVEVCLQYETRSTFSDKINVEYTLEVEKVRRAIRKKSRVFFSDGHESMYTNTKKLNKPSAEKCDLVKLFVQHDIKDILRPIDITLSYRLPETTPTLPNEGDAVPSLSTFPVLNMTSTLKQAIQVDFVKECGDDNICQADLVVTGKFDLPGDPPTLSLGTRNELVVMIEVDNHGESAYEAKFSIQAPESLDFVNVESTTSKEGVILSCDNTANVTIIECDLGNPFAEHSEISFNLRFGNKRVKGSDSMLEMDMNVETTSKDIAPDSNMYSISAKVEVVTDLNLFGESSPPEVRYSGAVRGESAMEYEDQIGNIVSHTYILQNFGPGKVDSAFLTIEWPYETGNGKWLLYMTDYPKIIGPGTCNIDSGRVNFLQVKRRRSDSTVEYVPGEIGSTKRRKREVSPSYDLIGPTGEKKGRVETLSCDHETAKCFTFNCTLGPLEGGTSASVKIMSRLWNSTFLEDYRAVTKVNIVSKGEVKIIDAPFVRQTDIANDKEEVITEATPDIDIREGKKGIPIWIYIVAALAGLLLLIIVVLILWKCGFFKRKRVGENKASFRGTSRHSRNGSMDKRSYKYETAYQEERYN
ncbi:integrin alpha-6-like [Glandiceps talaboti]